MQDTIQQIRKQCRLAMNGIASTSMRKRGLDYKINFGLAIQQIKDLSKDYQQSAELAEKLWIENTRELKILATLLYPIDNFSEETAKRWVTEIPNQEVREQVCINLFQNLPYAQKVASIWSISEDSNIRTTGYWLLARLFLSKKNIDKVEANSFKYIWEDATSENIFLRNAALLGLRHIGRQSKQEADIILNRLDIYRENPDLIKQEAYNNLAFEFEYFYEN